MADNPLEGLLSPDELKWLKNKREDERKNAERTVRIRHGDSEADLPWGEAVPWLKKTFGIGVSEDEDEVVTKDDAAGKDDDQGDGKDKTVRFGRRTG